MYVAKVPNRGSPPAILLRESYREDGKVKNRTLANLSRWPEAKVEALAAVLKGLPPKVSLEDRFEILRSLPHGHVAAVLGVLRNLGLEELIDLARSRPRDLVVAMIVAQVIDPSSKLACARGLRGETASSSLGEVLGLTGADEDDLYQAMDWLRARQGAIEDAVAARHLQERTLVLYDVSSAAFEGTKCPLGAIGHARDGVRGRLQIVYGLLTSKAGVPVAIEVFKGNTGDPATVASHVKKLKERFSISHVCLVGDRGMLTKARLEHDVVPAELDFITALRAPDQALVEGGAIQLSLFDTQTSRDHPSRLPRRASRRARTRSSPRSGRQNGVAVVLDRAELQKIAAAVARSAGRCGQGQDRAARRKVVNATRWPSTSSSRSQTMRSHSNATRKRSLPRPPDGSTCCARASPTRRSKGPTSSRPTRP
jgi:hypothetical protein